MMVIAFKKPCSLLEREALTSLFSSQKECVMNHYPIVLEAAYKYKVILLVEQQLPGDEEECMHLVRIPNSGYLVLCDAPTGEDCIVCGRPTCPAHFSGRTLFVRDQEKISEYPVCVSCSPLPYQHLEALRQARLILNQEPGDTHNG
jgi:hypothetical protein